MTTPSENLKGRLKGVGISLSASPPLQELKVEVDSRFDAGNTEEEVRLFVAEYVVDHEDVGLRALLGLNRKASRMPAGKGLIEIATHFAKKLKKKSIRDLLVEWTLRNKLDGWLADFMVEWSLTGEPPALSGKSARVVGDFKLGEDGEPQVFLFASALCDPDEVCEEFKRKCALTFPPETWVRKGFAVRDAMRLKEFEGGASDFDIAKAELQAEGWEWVATDTREYNAEVKKRANSVLVSRNRWLEYVTGLIDSTSRNPD